MRKLISLIAFVITLALVSCGGNSPSSAAEAMIKASNDNDYETVVKYIGDKDGNALSKDRQDGLVSLMKDKGTKNDDQKVKSFKILSEELSDDGNEATVKYEVTYEGTDTPKEQTLKLKKGEDGQWRTPLNK